MDISPERILVALGKKAENISIFGTLSVSGKDRYAGSYPIYGGEPIVGGVAMAAVFTKEKLHFYSTTVKLKRIIPLNDVVTATNGKILISIGGKTFKEYMETNGMGIGTNLPFFFYNQDGAEIVRICTAVTPEGYGVFLGDIPKHTAIAVCKWVSKEDIVKTAAELLSQASSECGDVSGYLVYSCVARRIIIGADENVELQTIEKNIGGKAFSLSYVGGEIFPQTTKDGRLVSYFQNNTLIVCVFP
jgi:hypothetical protein